MHASILRYLDAVARLGSIRRAAAALNIASSAVNRQILKLEDEIGMPLFQRVGNGMRPTPAGELIIRHARGTLSDWQHVRAEVNALTGRVHGEVRILSIPASVRRLLPMALTKCAHKHPDVTFRVNDTDPVDTLEEMRAGRPDVAIIFIDRRYREYEIVTSLHARVGAVMHPSHPLAGRSSLTLTECASYPVALLGAAWAIDHTAEVEFAQSGARFKTVVHTNSFSMSREVMQAGLAIGFFTPLGFLDDIAAGALVHIPLSGEAIGAADIGLFVHRGRGASPAASVFVRELVEAFDHVSKEIAAVCPSRS